jgi:hypothetical protein
VYKIRSEYDLWPVFFIHSLLEVGGLLEGGPSRRLRLTPKGEQFLISESPVQVLFLLETWWFHTNWLIAYPFEGMGEQLPHDFTLFTLDHLLELSADHLVPFNDFADRLIQATGLKWEASNMKRAQNHLRQGIARMVISVLEDFGVAEWEEDDSAKEKHRILPRNAFIISNLGRSLLQTVAGEPL